MAARIVAYVRIKQNVRDKVGRIEDSAGNAISQGFLIAEDVNDYFSSVFIEEDISSLPDSDANFQKNESASSMVAPFNTLLVDVAPTPLQTEKGLEFLNRRVHTLFRNAGIHDFSTHNEEKKARIVERFNRTLKTRMCLYLMKHQAW